MVIKRTNRTELQEQEQQYKKLRRTTNDKPYAEKKTIGERDKTNLIINYYTMQNSATGKAMAVSAQDLDLDPGQIYRGISTISRRQ